MNPEAKKAVPDDDAAETATATYAGTEPETNADTDTDTEDDATADDEYRMSLHDRVVIGLALGVALGLCILLGTVLRVPGS